MSNNSKEYVKPIKIKNNENNQRKQIQKIEC